MTIIVSGLEEFECLRVFSFLSGYVNFHLHYFGLLTQAIEIYKGFQIIF